MCTARLAFLAVLFVHVFGQHAEWRDCVKEPLASSPSRCCKGRSSCCRYANCKRLRELVNLVIVGEHCLC